MKTFLTLSLHLFITSFLFAQAPQGIPYQAVMRNADGSVMASSAVSLTFMIHDGSATGTVVYQESHALTSNAQGLVSCVVGNGVVSQGNFANINWGSGAKFLHVMMGITDLGTQQMLSVPYALYSKSADNATNATNATNAINAQTAANGFSNVSQVGDTLYMSNGTFIIVPGISAANYPAPVLGCTNALSCNYNVAATQDDGSCLYQNATCDDGNANTMNDVIDDNCTCSGVLMVNGCTNAQACNYNPAANVDNGSCLIQGASCDDGNANTINDIIESNCQCSGIIGLFSAGSGVTDVDGNFYPSIIINGKEWMQKNLNVSKYRNLQAINTGFTNTNWVNTTTGGYASYNDIAGNGLLYGKLYNWYAVNDSRGLCPVNWHVATDAEWSALESFLGGTSVAGGKMKMVTGWDNSNIAASNLSGFSALPGGDRYGYTLSPVVFTGGYKGIGTAGVWWSSSSASSTAAFGRELHFDSESSFRYSYMKHGGFSVRCVRD